MEEIPEGLRQLLDRAAQSGLLGQDPERLLAGLRERLLAETKGDAEQVDALLDMIRGHLADLGE